MINQERLVKEFMEMVKIDSLSHKEGKFASYLKDKLIELGLEVYVDEQADGRLVQMPVIFLVVQGNRQDVPVILLFTYGYCSFR